ncbi:MAG: hypothetical protein LBG58_08310 [Planctomycetaceae bacterium]|nr:hypothetical protein [Planctomycetaceae bacterium]
MFGLNKLESSIQWLDQFSKNNKSLCNLVIEDSNRMPEYIANSLKHGNYRNLEEINTDKIFSNKKVVFIGTIKSDDTIFIYIGENCFLFIIDYR